MPNEPIKDIIEIQSLSKMEQCHQEIINLIFQKNNLSIVSAVGLLELVKNEIMNNPDLYDEFDEEEK